MSLHVHSDGSYLSKRKVKSQSASYNFCTSFQMFRLLYPIPTQHRRPTTVLLQHLAHEFRNMKIAPRIYLQRHWTPDELRWLSDLEHAATGATGVAQVQGHIRRAVGICRIVVKRKTHRLDPYFWRIP
jgi:hypothetical protein